MNNLNEVLEKITEFIKIEAKTETIIGQQFKLGEFNCVPVMSVGLGFGGAGGEGDAKITGETHGNGMGGGAGIGMGPIGFLVNKGSEIQFIPTRSSSGLSAAIEKLPDLVNKYFDKKKEKVAA